MPEEGPVTPASGGAKLVLEDGSALGGRAFGAECPAEGEVVFNTGMVGYPEALTDPSYRGQILVLTYPLVGNYGVPSPSTDQFGLPAGFESSRIQVSGLVVSEACSAPSHHRSGRSLHEWLASEDVPGVSSVDTRKLTRNLRSSGTMLGRIGADPPRDRFFDPNATDLVGQTSISEVRLYRPKDDIEPQGRILLVDCGCKASIKRSLLARGFEVMAVPSDYYFLSDEFDALLISNGPGDPAMCKETVLNVSRAFALGRPILGICLGHQIMGLAAGADTYKMKFGHRSQNQPSLEAEAPGGGGRRCYITSQNHGYAIEERSLPEDWTIWMTNANDGSIEAIRHRSKPFIGVQFHPEASPGPVDCSWIFDHFCGAAAGSRES